MSEMAKILRCELCGSQEYKDHVVDRTVQKFLIGETEAFGLRVKTHILMDEQYGIETEVRQGRCEIPLAACFTKITHCPFCGRELDD